jgi:uncharacterized protein YggT (Ycf19 family)
MLREPDMYDVEERRYRLSSDPDRREAFAARVFSVFDYAFGALYVLIAIELVLELVGARDGNAFKHFLDALTAPFLSPFAGLLPTFRFGRSELELSFLAAMLVYALIHYGLRRLLLLFVRPRERV